MAHFVDVEPGLIASTVKPIRGHSNRRNAVPSRSVQSCAPVVLEMEPLGVIMGSTQADSFPVRGTKEELMKKLLLPLAAIMLLALAVPSFADWELGLGISPSQNSTSTD